MNDQPEFKAGDKIEAGLLAPWDVGDLPLPPISGWKMWMALIGPGVVLAGTSIGTGEWLFGPAVSAQYGATLLWMALTSVILQVFCNLMAMRYAIYCGEPMIVGALRTRPGPLFWIGVILVLDFAAIWPYNASNAAVPLAAAFLGRLPQSGVQFDDWLVKTLGFSIFLLAFVPLVFGGTVYRMLEKIMTAKLVIVLGFLTFVAVFFVSPGVMSDVVKGFFRFGTVPLRPDVLIVGRHFNVKFQADGQNFRLAGTWEADGTATGDLFVPKGYPDAKYDLRKTDKWPAALAGIHDVELAGTRPFAKTQRYFLQTTDEGTTWIMEGDVVDHHRWTARRIEIRQGSETETYSTLAQVPQPHRGKLEQYLEHEGLEHVSLIGYAREKGKMPPLDWAMIVAFIAIAGAGGLTNSMFSNYARDKGWGMGYHVGAIPSAFGGLNVGVSHVGRAFHPTGENLARWKGWIRHILRDQTIWIVASVIGMALPCMMSLEFIRNASVVGDRVAAMTGEGIANRYPSFGGTLWFLTLLCGFLVLAPGQVSASDQLARRWTDIIWTISPAMQRLGSRRVKSVYYGILGLYCIGGLVILVLLPAVKIATISSVLQNFALGTSALLSLYLNRTLLPRQVQPNWLMQIGSAVCGIFFLAISGAVVAMWISQLK